MANALYDTGRNAFLTGDIDWVADTIKVVLVDAADYTVNLSTHDFWMMFLLRLEWLLPRCLRTASAGVADAADTTFTAVSGDVSEALVIYKDSGVESTSQLIAYIDTATGLAVTPNGGDIVVQWDSGANKIFKL